MLTTESARALEPWERWGWGSTGDAGAPGKGLLLRLGGAARRRGYCCSAAADWGRCPGLRSPQPCWAQVPGPARSLRPSWAGALTGRAEGCAITGSMWDRARAALRKRITSWTSQRGQVGTQHLRAGQGGAGFV